MSAAARLKVAQGNRRKQTIFPEMRLTSCSQSSRHLSISGMQRSYGSALRFEAYLELSSELVKAGFHPTGDVGPTPWMVQFEPGPGVPVREMIRCSGKPPARTHVPFE